MATNEELLLQEVQKVTQAGLENAQKGIQSTNDLAGDDTFNVNVPDFFDAGDLGGNDSINDIQANLDATGLRVKELSDPSQQEIELGADIKKQDLQAQEAQRNLYGQGMGTPLSLLQGEQRKMQEQRSFDRAFDMMELDLLESSRAKELKVAQGELTQAQAEAEQLADTIKVNDSIVERIGKTFQGSSIADIQSQSPETYSKLIESLANSNYTLGELEQALKAPEENLRFANVNGSYVGIDPKTGEVKVNVGRAGSGSTGSSGTGTGSGLSSSLFQTVLNNVPTMTKTSAERFTNQLLSKGVDESVIESMSQNNPDAFKKANIAIMSSNDILDNITSIPETGGLTQVNEANYQAYVDSVLSQGYFARPDSNGNETIFYTPPEEFAGLVNKVEKLQQFENGGKTEENKTSFWDKIKNTTMLGARMGEEISN